MSEVTVSIIIPVYNAEKILHRCLDSIINNTYKDYEIILVNDGSKDNSYDICLDYASRYNFIKTITNEKNRGVSYTRNNGVRHAKGKYLIFIDSDDYIENNYLEILVNTIDEYKESLVICGFVNEDMKYNQRIEDILYSTIDIDNINIKYLEELYNKTLLQQLWNKIFIKNIIADNNILFDESINVGEDTKFVLQYLMYSNCYDICVINKILYHYMRDQSTSLMYNVNYTHLDVSLDNMKMLYKLLGKSDKEIDTLISNKRLSMLNNHAYIIFRNKNMSFKDKRHNIYNLDPILGKKLFRDNVILYIKELIKKFI